MSLTRLERPNPEPNRLQHTQPKDTKNKEDAAAMVLYKRTSFERNMQDLKPPDADPGAND